MAKDRPPTFSSPTLLRIFAVAVVGSAILQAEPVDFVKEVRPILEAHCYECHGEKKQKAGLRLDVKSAAFKGGDKHSPDIIPGKPKESPLFRFITTDDEDEIMPPKGKRLSSAEIATLTAWISEGATWPDGVDLAKLEDQLDHWSFKPLQTTTNQATIDTFIDAKLKENGLTRSPAADPASLIRRLAFDLTGLPPTPEQVDAFVAECRSGSSFEVRDSTLQKLVEQFLSSRRYGEHWAQHWLDVVRYADTHGFEVNTERPNAWPYRDYVIDAFNADLPYDQFIRHQIVADAGSPEKAVIRNQEAATGFLITASVLLPGQIGKDAPSMRLARQDSLDEMVNNIGQTFLGLSVGCARCHDHKFDPISSKDYYAMQAFVAGVEYADRPLRTKEAAAREKEIAPLRQQVAAIDERLTQFIPLAHPGAKPRATSAEQNTESFAPLEAKFVRFTIHDANLHPKLGLIEPCIDEFEIYAGEKNIARDTKVTASGSRTSAMHKLEHINDGQYGNSKSWMADQKGRGWVEFELAKPTLISKIIWGRDRTGKFTDRLATAFTLQAGPSKDKLVTLIEALPPRPTVNWKLTTDRFAPVTAKRLRFTILATNGLEPCLDELEVMDTQGHNIAREAKVTTSGNLIVPDRHDPDFINDGQYGNERSWLGNESGKGWVELEFKAEHEITRVVWSRDRQGKLEDRMTTEYRIEVAQSDAWQLVADSSDRRPFVAGTTIDPVFTLSGLPLEESKAASRLLDEKQKLEANIKAAEQGQLAFAGKFRTPDEIHLLTRGDPEQPKEEVVPAVLSSLGKLKLAKDSPEQDRRHALADWIASPQNPLTARVMVNRIWQGHFGSGLVATPSDFGHNGMKPTHPELLDWLANEFVLSGWSVKHVHRLIVMSATYRQSSQIQISSVLRAVESEIKNQKSAIQKDSEAKLLWHFPTRRLEAEALHDSMLAISGQLNLSMYGRGYDLFDKRGGLSGFNPVEKFTPENQRRMIYAHKVRRESEAVFGAFDCPDAGQSTATRRASTTPIQALNLFNSAFTLAQAQAFAARIQTEAGADTAKQIQRAYQLALNRSATPEELRDTQPIIEQQGLTVLCRVLFNSNEFLFVP